MENIIGHSSPEIQLRERQPLVLRILAHFFSYVFHPIFIPVYVTLFMVYLQPLSFASYDEKKKIFIPIAVFFSSGFLPAFSVFLMRRLGFVNSLFLRTQKERIIPYAAAIIFYFWIWYVFRSQPDSPVPFVQFLLGSFLGVCGAWLWNIRIKVSMHSTAMGGLLMFFLLQAVTGQELTGLYLAYALVIAGVVCTSRLIVSDHTLPELYLGLFTGILCQIIAWWI
jgi:hypothetical protein